MINMDQVIEQAINKGASDIHLMSGLKPLFRITRALVDMEGSEVLKDEDMFEVYDYLVEGNVDKDKVFNETRKLDTSYEFNGIRLRVNLSYSNEIPVCTMRIIKNELPKYEDLGVPDIVRRMTYQPQGLILVTGKTNSGKSTRLFNIS